MYSWLPILLLILIVLLILSVLGSNNSKKKKLSQIRERWGKPKYANRSFKFIAAYLNDSSDSTISPDTTADLNLDDLFEYIDRTNSKPGQQYLYKKLHTPGISEAYFDALEKQIAFVNRDQNLRELAELELSKLSHFNAYYLPGLFSKPQQPLFKPLFKFYIAVAPFLTITLFISLFIIPNQFAFVLLLLMVVGNVAIHFINKIKTVGYTPSLPQLLILYDVGKWLAKNKLFEDTGTVDDSLNKIAKLKKSLSFINLQNKLEGDPTDISFLIAEWLKMFLLIEPLVFIISIGRVNKYLDNIKTLFEAVAAVDMAISIQSVREGCGYYCKPQFITGSDNISIKGLYHPLIENCIANSINIDNKQGVLITGSNMSGKTTFIRAVAINAILSQTINTSFAHEYCSPPLKVSTSININDDLEENKSYFQAEALSVKSIIEDVAASGPINSLVIIDEIFRGTNTIERIAAAKAVLSYLIKNESFVFVSTHDLELAELLGEDYKVFSFEELIVDGQLVFDYKIKEGLLKNKNGIAVLKRLGFPDSIIDEATQVSAQLRSKYNL
jgi:hypothetical protein